MAGLSFYSPNGSGNGGANNGSGGATQYSSVPNPTGRTGFGYLDNQQVGTDQWGTGDSFQGAGRQAVIGALQGSMSGQNPLDMQGLDESRQYLRNTLADLPGQESNQISSFDTQAQRGLSNLLSQHAASSAGNGNMGSRQYSGAAGDITARAGSDYMNGLIQARANALQQGLGITQGLEGIQGGDLAQRQFQLQQGQALANGYEGLMGMDAGRQNQLESERFNQQQTDQAMLNNDIMGVAQGGAMLATGMPSAPKTSGGAQSPSLGTGAGPTAAAASPAAYQSTYGNQYANPDYFNNMMNGAGYAGSGGF